MPKVVRMVRRRPVTDKPLWPKGGRHHKPHSVSITQQPEPCYRKIEVLGAGASGTVWAAQNSRTNQIVALKIVNSNPKEPCDIMAFIASNEVRALQKAHHGNIIGLIDNLTISNAMWIVMEYMNGGCLTEILDHWRMSEDCVSRVAQGSSLAFSPH
jgi:serine/threonine protein kinase